MMAQQITRRLTISPDLHPGYRLRRLRGRGAFGEVWEAETEAGAAVALKFLASTGSEGAVQELRSLQIVRQLQHPYLTRIDRVWAAPGCLVIAMELADGSLADLLEVYQAELATPLPADHLCPLLAQAAQALDFLNTRQHLVQGQWVTVQHCDVKPTNILVFGKTVKLNDFGLTTTLCAGQRHHYRAGTPDYAAPEVFQGRLSDRTDQYALAVCYCVLRGSRLPFPNTPAGLPPDYVRPEPDLSMLTPAERPVLARALAPAPPDRWPTCGELIARLARLAGGAQAEAAPHAERRREGRFAPGAGLRCEVLATLGNGAWQATVQNLSSAGIRLRVAEPGCALMPGRLLALTLWNDLTGVRHQVHVRLAHSTAQDGGDYEVGGAFDRTFTQEELTALSESGPAGDSGLPMGGK
jgi:hypothetical protein